MYVKSLSLKNFRNIQDETLSFTDGVNILTGENAQGKTNIIEAMWLFSAFKSFRTVNEKDFIMKGEDFSRIDIAFEREEKKYNGTIKYFLNKRREILLNDIKMKPGEIIGTFLSVMFFPEHLNLVKQGPEERRKFIDFALCQINPHYFGVLSLYNKILFQRNNLLKSESDDIKRTMSVWDEKLAKTGAEVYMGRKKYIEMLKKYASPVIDDMSGKKEILDLEYKSFCDSENGQNAEEELLLLLKNNKEKDFYTGFTNAGPHKDNMEILLNGNSARSFGSQGQQRSAVMALKLAETEIVNDTYGEYPVLLFDDVFSELDESRKAYITDKIKNRQVIITSCENTKKTGNEKVFKIRGGMAVEI